MKTIDAARRVTKKDPDDIPHFTEAIARLFDMQYLDGNPSWGNWSGDCAERDRLKGYWIHRWMCTDTHVGEMAYFLDDELVLVCAQTARKNDAYIYFVDKEAYEKVKVFMDYFRELELDNPEFLADQETDEVVQFKFADSCLHRKGVYQGREVVVAHIPYNIRRDLNLPGCDDVAFYSLFPYVYVVENQVKTPVLVSELSFSLHIDGN